MAGGKEASSEPRVSAVRPSTDELSLLQRKIDAVMAKIALETFPKSMYTVEAISGGIGLTIDDFCKIATVFTGPEGGSVLLQKETISIGIEKEMFDSAMDLVPVKFIDFCKFLRSGDGREKFVEKLSKKIDEMRAKQAESIEEMLKEIEAETEAISAGAHSSDFAMAYANFERFVKHKEKIKMLQNLTQVFVNRMRPIRKKYYFPDDEDEDEDFNVCMMMVVMMLDDDVYERYYEGLKKEYELLSEVGISLDNLQTQYFNHH